jgi:macrodomain Ter protein organizer (MatP/YcbG family)
MFELLERNVYNRQQSSVAAEIAPEHVLLYDAFFKHDSKQDVLQEIQRIFSGCTPSKHTTINKHVDRFRAIGSLLKRLRTRTGDVLTEEQAGSRKLEVDCEYFVLNRVSLSAARRAKIKQREEVN